MAAVNYICWRSSVTHHFVLLPALAAELLSTIKQRCPWRKDAFKWWIERAKDECKVIFKWWLSTTYVPFFLKGFDGAQLSRSFAVKCFYYFNLLYCPNPVENVQYRNKAENHFQISNFTVFAN
jgi:hypothetical protein